MVLVYSGPTRESFPGEKWPFYRGTRVGRIVQERGPYRHGFIEVITPGTANHSRHFTKSSRSPRCLTNCSITATLRDKPSRSSSLFVPTLLLSNVMSLTPKIDQIREVVHNTNFDLVCITKSWLKDHIQLIITASQFWAITWSFGIEQGPNMGEYGSTSRNLFDSRFSTQQWF